MATQTDNKPTAASNGATPPAAADPFESIPMAELPETVVKSRSPEDAKLATMLVAAMTRVGEDGKPSAAREAKVHATRADAVKRASQLKRLAEGAPEFPKGKRAATRIIPVAAGGSQVAIYIADPLPPKGKAAAAAAPAEAAPNA